MSLRKHRNLSDNVVAYMAARPGQFFASCQLGKMFEIDTKTMRAMLEGMVGARISSSRIYGKRLFYVPSQEQIEALTAQPKIKPWREYVVPKPMTDLMARIKAERDAIPSHYGSDAPQPWKARESR